MGRTMTSRLGRTFSLCLVCWLICTSGCGDGEDESRLLPSETEIAQAAAQLNVLVVVLDAAARDHFGFYGYHRETTPHLDAVAAESVVFENAYAQAAGTLLSVYSYFTSRYPVFGEDLQVYLNSVLAIEPEMTTMAEIMGSVFSHRLGGTSNGYLQSVCGHGQGFSDYWHSWELPPQPGRDSHRDILLADAALEWMRQNAAEGFFAYLHFIKPHRPYQPPEPFLSRFVEGEADPAMGTNGYIIGQLRGEPPPDFFRHVTDLYDGNLAHIDHEVGRLIQELEAAGIWEQTLFVLTSDHGEGFAQHDKLMGHGDFVYEEVIRVPLLIRIPGLSALEGRRVSEPVELVDLVPTLMALKAVASQDEELAGRSLVPLMAGQDRGSPRFVHSRTNRTVPPSFVVRRGNLKLIYHEGTGQVELYDLDSDPGEKEDLMAGPTGQDLAEPLMGYLLTWLQSRGQVTDAVHIFPADSLDEKTRQQLRALGYID